MQQQAMYDQFYINISYYYNLQFFGRSCDSDYETHVKVPPLSMFTDSSMVAVLPGSVTGTGGAIKPPALTSTGSSFYPGVLYEARHVLVLQHLLWLVKNLRLVQDMSLYRNRSGERSQRIPPVRMGAAPARAVSIALPPRTPLPPPIAPHDIDSHSNTSTRVERVIAAPASANVLHLLQLSRALAARGTVTDCLYTDATPIKLKSVRALELAMESTKGKHGTTASAAIPNPNPNPTFGAVSGGLGATPMI